MGLAPLAQKSGSSLARRGSLGWCLLRAGRGVLVGTIGRALRAERGGRDFFVICHGE